MTEAEFERLVEWNRLLAERRPGFYRLRVMALIAFGHGFLLGMIVLMLLAGLTLAVLMAFTLKLLVLAVAAPFVAFAVVLGEAVWATPPPGEGETIELADAPELFRMIELVRLELRAPPLDRVGIVHGLTASIRLRARPGGFGTRRELEIGLPLMQALTPEQLRAVIAHELGHIAGDLDRVSAMVLQATFMWDELGLSLGMVRHPGRSLIRGFFAWYRPYFAASTLVLRREHEYAADRAAARVTSPGIVAGTLARLALMDGVYKRRVVPAVMRRARDEKLPVSDVYGFNDVELTRREPEEKRRRWLAIEYAARTGATDTHPCLTDRLAALGSPPIADPPGPASPELSASRLLGSAGPKMRQALEREWKGLVLGQWETIHRAALEQRKRVAALEEKERTTPLDPDERLQVAISAAAGLESGPALERLEAVLREQPDHVDTQYVTAMLRLENDAEGGEELMERAIERDPSLLLAAHTALAEHRYAHGRAAEIPALNERARRQREAEEAEDLGFLRGETIPPLEPHGLPEPFVRSLATALTDLDAVQVAYLVRRPLARRGVTAAFVLALRPKPATLAATMRKRQRLIMERAGELVRNMPGRIDIVLLNAGSRALQDAFEAVPGGRVFGAWPSDRA